MFNSIWRKTYRGPGVQNWFDCMPHDWGYPMVPVLCWHPLQFVCQTLSSVRFLFFIKKILCSTLYGEKPIGVKGSKIGLTVCPMIGAIQWCQFYAGTPSSLFVRHCLVFDFYFLYKYILCSTLYGEKPIGVQGSNIGLIVCPMIGAIQWYQFYAGTPSSLGAWCAPKIPPPSKFFIFFFVFFFRFLCVLGPQEHF